MSARRPSAIYRTGSAGLTRDLNRVAVLRLIGAAGPIARTHIAKQLGLSPATVTSLTRELLDSGIVRVADHAPSSGGRPAVLLELVGSAATALGVKVAPDHLVGVRVDLDAQVLERFELRFDATAADSVDRLGDALADWIGPAGSQPPLLGIGLGLPGVVDARHGRVSAPMLGWHELALGDLLQERLGVPVLVDNDVNTLAVSERLYGRGRDVEHFITVTIGRGVGLGIVAGGDIYRGFRGGAGEFGHTTGADDGPLCSCGKRGCLEALVADPALVARARRARLLTSSQGIEKLLALADGGSAKAHAIFAEAGSTLGRAVGDLANVLGPELVLVSGEGTQAWQHIAPEFERTFRAALFSPLRTVSLEVDPWDDVKWAVGAATLVLRVNLTAPLDGSATPARPGSVPVEVVA